MGSDVDSLKRLGSMMVSVAFILNGYSTAASADQEAQAKDQSVRQLDSSFDRLAAEAHRMMSVLEDIKSMFAKINLSIMENEIPARMLAKEHITNLCMMVIIIRKMEADLKVATPPAELADVHMALRRSMAQARFELALTQDFHRQTLSSAKPLESDIDLEALKSFATASTKRLLELAEVESRA